MCNNCGSGSKHQLKCGYVMRIFTAKILIIDVEII